MKRAGLMVVCFLALLGRSAAAESSILYVQVIRGSDQPQPAATNWIEIGPKLSGKLSGVFRWKHYWETARTKVAFDPTKISQVALGNQRTLEIERLKSGDLEVRLACGKKLVTKTRQPAGSHMAILSGEEANKESFFIVVRPDEPAKRE